MAMLRELDASAEPREHWQGKDGDGGLWLFETVESEGEYWVVRQVEITAGRRVRKYSWRHIEDDHGFLTDQPLELWEFGMTRLTAEVFEQLWDAVDCECGGA
ncbi:hypothetical protein Misp01_15680 [Microtetraspora sp. NBRC 13810]|nr:hypothetical protein Misp01_15680 [Microtetraspora sp. NBRC 13810]